MFYKKILLILFAIISYTIVAQNKIDYLLYNNNLSLINPSFSGYKDYKELLINSKIQWLGVHDAPRTNVLSLNLPLKSNMGVDFGIINTKTFIVTETEIGLGYSYKVQLSEKHNLRFGLKMHGSIYSVDVSKVKVAQQSDGYFSKSDNKFTPYFSTGVNLTNGMYYLHLSVRDILKKKSYSNELKKSRLNLFVGGGYAFYLNDNVKITPSTLVNIEEGLPIYVDINSDIEINQKHNVGISYLWNNSLQFYGIISATEWLKLGYGYRFQTSSVIRSGQGGTHEFIGIFNLNNIFKKKSKPL